MAPKQGEFIFLKGETETNIQVFIFKERHFNLAGYRVHLLVLEGWFLKLWSNPMLRMSGRRLSLFRASWGLDST